MNRGNFEHHGQAVILIGGSGSLPLIFNGGTVIDIISMVEEHSEDEYHPGGQFYDYDHEKEFTLSNETHINHITGIDYFNGAANSVYDVSKYISACDGDGFKIAAEGEDEGISSPFTRGIAVELGLVYRHSEKCASFLETCLTDYTEADDVPPMFIVQVSHFKISKEEEARIEAIPESIGVRDILEEELGDDDEGSIFGENAKWVEMARTCSLVAFAFKNT